MSLFNWLQSLRPPQAHKGGFFHGSREKCPQCGHWSSAAQPHVWSEMSDAPELFVMTCPNGHQSHWIVGPGLMLHVGGTADALPPL